MDRLAVRWFNKLEAEAAAAEYKSLKPTVVAEALPARQNAESDTAETWRALYELFDALAEEELKTEPQNRNDRWMRAYVSYKDPNFKWGRLVDQHRH